MTAPPSGRLPDRRARLAALVGVLAPWDRTGAPLAALAEALDVVYALAMTEADRPKPQRLSGAARRRLAKRPGATRGEAVPPGAPAGAVIVRWRELDRHGRTTLWHRIAGRFGLPQWRGLAFAFGDLGSAFSLPTLARKADTRPAMYAADAAMDAAVAAFEWLTGRRATRINVERVRPGTRTHSETMRRGDALAFAVALDGFYGLSLATDTRMAEAISRATAGRARRSAYGGAE